MTVIRIPASFPVIGQPYSAGYVRVILDTGPQRLPGHQISTGKELLGNYTIPLPADGSTLELDLIPQDDIYPEGTQYVVQYDQTEYARRIAVPADGGPYDVGHPTIQAVGPAPAVMVTGPIGPSPVVISEDPDTPLLPGQVLFVIEPNIWTPNDIIDDVLAWWDPADIIDADGADITTWTDKVTGEIFAPIVGGVLNDVPQHDADGLNGTPSVFFPGVSALNDGTITWGAGALTVLVAYQFSATTTTQQVFNGHASSSLQTFGFGKTSGQWTFARGNASITSGTSNNDLSYAVATFNGASSNVRVNGTQVIAGDAGTTAPTNFRLGLRTASSASTAMTDGRVGHVLVVNRVLTVDELAGAEAWLASTVGL